eukprot:UN0851
MHCFTIRKGRAHLPDGEQLKLRKRDDVFLLEGKPIFIENGELCRTSSRGVTLRWIACGIPGEPNGPCCTPSPIRGRMLDGMWELMPQLRSNISDASEGCFKICRGKIVGTWDGSDLELEMDGQGRAWIDGGELFLVGDLLMLVSEGVVGRSDVLVWRQPMVDADSEDMLPAL